MSWRKCFLSDYTPVTLISHWFTQFIFQRIEEIKKCEWEKQLMGRGKNTVMFEITNKDKDY